MASRRDLARRALAEALRLRAEAGIPFTDPIDPIDLAERHGVEARFVDIPSLEGMFVDFETPLILIPAQRPAGRQRFACAHEFAHYHFGHGTMASSVALGGPLQSTKPEEFVADALAGFLLMPRQAVERGFRTRHWSVRTCTATQVYSVACWLGVSYAALLTHMHNTLKVLSARRFETLKRIALRDIRSKVVGFAISPSLLVVDKYWTGRAVDARVGDLILVPHDQFKARGSNLRYYDQIAPGALYQAARPGIGHLISSRQDLRVRVMRHAYVGRSIFRHLEDPDYVAECSLD